MALASALWQRVSPVAAVALLTMFATVGALLPVADHYLLLQETARLEFCLGAVDEFCQNALGQLETTTAATRYAFSFSGGWLSGSIAGASWLALGLVSAFAALYARSFGELGHFSLMCAYRGANRTVAGIVASSVLLGAAVVTALSIGAGAAGAVVGAVGGLGEPVGAEAFGYYGRALLLSAVAATLGALLGLVVTQRGFAFLLAFAYLGSPVIIRTLPLLTRYTPGGLASDFFGWRPGDGALNINSFGTMTPNGYSPDAALALLLAITGALGGYLWWRSIRRMSFQ